MADTDDDFTKAFDGFGEDEQPVKPDVVVPKEEPKEDEPTNGAEDKPTPETSKKPETPEEIPSTPTDEKKEVGEPKPPETPEAPSPPEPAQPLTKDDVTAIISNLRSEERNSGREVETTTQEVLEAYYPEGLSNTLIDEKSGKELKTPADVVAASGDSMTIEDAAQWLMNEQYKLDQQVNNIKNQAKEIAETTVNFKRDAVAAVQKYEPLFKAYPYLQQKVYDKLMKQVKVDKDKNVVLSAPDVLEHYDDYLEPYQQAFEFANNKPATNPTAPTTPEPPKPTAEDRMDVAGDGGVTKPNDPNDFAQQVSKELAKGI